MADATIEMLTGGPELTLPDRGIVHQPTIVIGDGVAGAPNSQPFQIFRDERPIAADELQGLPYHQSKLARHPRDLPLNPGWGPAGIDPMQPLPGLPLQQGQRPGPFGPQQNPALKAGVAAPEVLANPRTVLYTGTGDVGWQGWS